MKDKGILIAMLCTAIVIMAAAYAAFSTTLTINGTASISSTWEVGFDQEASSCSDGSLVSVNGTLATLGVELESPGDSVTCTLTVKNTGTLDARLESISVTPSGTAPITFTTSPAVGSDLSTRPVLVKSNGTETITVTATYNADVESQPENIQNTVVVKANYVQAFSANQ
jgi:hypothetical protein